MTTIEIYGGACQFRTEARIILDGRDVKLEIESDCKYCQRLGRDLMKVGLADIFPERGRPAVGFMTNPVYKKADQHLPHVDCPVPCGLLKGILAEFGLQLKKSPTIEFLQ